MLPPVDQVFSIVGFYGPNYIKHLTRKPDLVVVSPRLGSLSNLQHHTLDLRPPAARSR